MYPYLFLYESNILKYYPSEKKCCSKKMYNDHRVALVLLAHCWVPLGGWRTQFENQGSKVLLSEHHCIKHLKGNNQALLSPVCTQTCFLVKLNPYSLPAIPIAPACRVTCPSSSLLMPIFLQAFALAVSASGTVLFFSSGFKVKLRATSSVSRAKPQAVISSSSLFFTYPVAQALSVQHYTYSH